MLSVFGNTHAASAKIAIVGDSPEADKVADLALAILSTKDNIAILERGEIDKLLKEHKLSHSGMTAAELSQFARIAHVDVFAIINSAKDGKKTVVSSLLVFDAKSGFKLQDVRLTSGFEDDVKSAIATIEAALNQMRAPQLVYVAVLAVRNAGVPAKYKYQLENIAEEIQRRLVATPEIAVLERSRLGLVSKERRLAGEQYRLLSSAYLLDFEFSQGTSADIVNLTFYILSSAGKMIKRYEYEDCLKASSKNVSRMISDINAYLKTSAPLQEVPTAPEAANYFREYEFYKQLKQYVQAKIKLESAIALEPKNIKYLVEYQKAIINAAGSERRISCDKLLDEYVKAGYAIISNGNLIHDLAPDNREWIFNQHALFEKMYNLYEWQDRKRNFRLISPEQLWLADEMLDKLEPVRKNLII